MLPLATSLLDKVDHAMDRIDAVKGSSRNLADTVAALDGLRARLQEHRSKLEDFANTPPAADALSVYCDAVLDDLFKLLPHVGFLHRSRNASNPFEIHGPLKRLARQFIGEDVRLIISNEWEFSPYTHPSMLGIEGFVLLGLPASEAADNVLLVPIAGHEFGHSVWRREKLKSQFEDRIGLEILSAMEAREAEVCAELGFSSRADFTSDRFLGYRDDLRDRALAQCEEIFCDFCGLLLFGDSYCYALAHLLAPGLIDSQDAEYPSARDRAEYLIEAGQKAGIEVPDKFAEAFVLPNATDVWSRIVAEAVNDCVEELLESANSHALGRSVSGPSKSGVAKAETQLREVTPVQFTSTLPEILCAAWHLRLDTTLWKSMPQLNAVKMRLMNELVLKSAESLEYWERVKKVDDVK
jgi:hypothetical protein